MLNIANGVTFPESRLRAIYYLCGTDFLSYPAPVRQISYFFPVFLRQSYT